MLCANKLFMTFEYHIIWTVVVIRTDHAGVLDHCMPIMEKQSTHCAYGTHSLSYQLSCSVSPCHISHINVVYL